MLRIALSTLAARKSGSLGALSAVVLVVVLVVSCGILLESSLRMPTRGRAPPRGRGRRAGQADHRVRAWRGRRARVPRASAAGSTAAWPTSSAACRAFRTPSPTARSTRSCSTAAAACCGARAPPRSVMAGRARRSRPTRSRAAARRRRAADVVLDGAPGDPRLAPSGRPRPRPDHGRHPRVHRRRHCGAARRARARAVALLPRRRRREARRHRDARRPARDRHGARRGSPRLSRTACATRSTGRSCACSPAGSAATRSRRTARSSREDIVAGLMVFGVLSAFIGIFVVASTFALSVRQRHRELALFRAIGSTPRQVRRMVAGEALLVALAAFAVAAPLARPRGAPRARPLREGEHRARGSPCRRRLHAVPRRACGRDRHDAARGLRKRTPRVAHPPDRGAPRDSAVQRRLSWLRTVAGLAMLVAGVATLFMLARGASRGNGRSRGDDGLHAGGGAARAAARASVRLAARSPARGAQPRARHARAGEHAGQPAPRRVRRDTGDARRLADLHDHVRQVVAARSRPASRRRSASPRGTCCAPTARRACRPPWRRRRGGLPASRERPARSRRPSWSRPTAATSSRFPRAASTPARSPG